MSAPSARAQTQAYAAGPPGLALCRPGGPLCRRSPHASAPAGAPSSAPHPHSTVPLAALPPHRRSPQPLDRSRRDQQGAHQPPEALATPQPLQARTGDHSPSLERLHTAGAKFSSTATRVASSSPPPAEPPSPPSPGEWTAPDRGDPCQGMGEIWHLREKRWPAREISVTASHSNQLHVTGGHSKLVQQILG